MTLYNKDAFMRNLWDWGILDGCFGDSHIRPTDVDGLVERNGKFLLLEAKSSGKEIPQGQQIMFNNLVKTGIFTVIIIWGQPDKPEKIQIWGVPPENATLEKFRSEVSDWYIEANV